MFADGLQHVDRILKPKNVWEIRLETDYFASFLNKMRLCVILRGILSTSMQENYCIFLIWCETPKIMELAWKGYGVKFFTVYFRKFG